MRTASARSFHLCLLPPPRHSSAFCLLPFDAERAIGAIYRPFGRFIITRVRGAVNCAPGFVLARHNLCAEAIPQLQSGDCFASFDSATETIAPHPSTPQPKPLLRILRLCNQTHCSASFDSATKLIAPHPSTPQPKPLLRILRLRNQNHCFASFDSATKTIAPLRMLATPALPGPCVTARASVTRVSLTEIDRALSRAPFRAPNPPGETASRRARE